MSRLVLGVVGHIDHGKSALVRALTGMETDRLAEEKRRGVTIALGFAFASIGGAMVDFVDAPGHERFVRTLVGGVTGADAVLLVVAADEGAKPQTREHLTIAALLGVQRAVVAISKCDRATPEQIARAAETAQDLAAELGLAVDPPIPVSALTGEGLDDLRAAIAGLAGRGASPDDGFAYLPIDRAFLVGGHGLVATGSLRRGRLRAGDAVELLPAGASVRIRGLQVHGEAVEEGAPGQRLAVNLRGVELSQVQRGAVLASAGALEPAEWLTVQLRAAPDAPPLANGARLELLIGAAAVPAVVRLLDRQVLEAGKQCFAQLHTAAPVAAPARDGFVLRSPSPSATVAGGRVLDPATRRLRRGDAAGLARLDRLAALAGPTALPLLVAEAGARGIRMDRLARLAGLSAARAAAAVEKLDVRVLKGGQAMVERAALNRLQRKLLARLSAAGSALSLAELSHAAPGAGPAVLEAALTALTTAGQARIEGARISFIRPQEERARATAAAALARSLERRLRAGGLAPPDLAAEAASPDGRRALAALVREGAVVRTFDRVQKREVLFHRSAVEQARRELAARLAPPGLSVGEVGRILGVSRKYSVPLLEHLDGVRFTRRQGDRRVLAD